MRRMRSISMAGALLLFALPALAGDGVAAGDVFDSLKSLAGTWHGTAEGQGEAAEAEVQGELVHEIQVSAAGTVVMETMRPGTEHEMINMYHLDGEDLLLTHYCAGGNQPRMRLDRAASTAENWVFQFDGGTNLDPATDPHIHDATIRQEGPDRLVSSWTGYAEGKEAGTMVFHLSRGE